MIYGCGATEGNVGSPFIHTNNKEMSMPFAYAGTRRRRQRDRRRAHDELDKNGSQGSAETAGNEGPRADAGAQPAAAAQRDSRDDARAPQGGKAGSAAGDSPETDDRK
ncbi:hypothetical protein [Cupriavidus pauculus]|uniref:hypothetical protein n=1 Tax=Cupriavidus pauculus TaxID=82633 RepID=UPI001D0BFBAA|nr:hypothetical protein [Cupriavidus pauculus]